MGRQAWRTKLAASQENSLCTVVSLDWVLTFSDLQWGAIVHSASILYKDVQYNLILSLEWRFRIGIKPFKLYTVCITHGVKSLCVLK